MKKLYPAQFEEIVDNDVHVDGYGNETFYEFSGGFIVTFRDVPEANTQGNSFAESLKMAEDALRTAMGFYVERGENYPAPSVPEHGEVMIELKTQEKTNEK